MLNMGFRYPTTIVIFVTLINSSLDKEQIRDYIMKTLETMGHKQIRVQKDQKTINMQTAL